MAAISLNGTTFYPSNVEEQREKIGTAIQAANGARRWAHRADKRTWTVSWESVPAATRNAVRTIFALTTTFTFVDEDGNSATVLCKEGAFKSSVAVISGVTSGSQTLYYDVSLELTEA